MKQFLSALGRKVSVVNLDPANHVLPYPCDVNMAELITLDDVMTSLNLGPNGGLLYCMDFLQANIDWLYHRLELLGDSYIVFDCPGQVELYTHNMSVKKIIERLTKWNIRVSDVCHGNCSVQTILCCWFSLKCLQLECVLKLVSQCCKTNCNFTYIGPVCLKH